MEYTTKSRSRCLMFFMSLDRRYVVMVDNSSVFGRGHLVTRFQCFSVALRSKYWSVV